MPYPKGLLIDVLNGGIGPDDARSFDRVLMQRVRTLNGYTLSQIALAVPLNVYLAYINNWIDLVAMNIWLLVLIAGARNIRRGGSATRTAAAQIVGLFIAVTVSVLHTGGLHSPLMFVFPLAGAYSGLIFGARCAGVCASIVCILLFAFFFQQRNGVALPDTIQAPAHDI